MTTTRNLLFIFFCLNITVQFSFAQGIDFYKGTFEEAKAEAKKLDKIIFVDGYTTWCGPCKRLAANVFPKEKVGDYFNKNFINLKLDMEKGEGKDFAKQYKVRSYPTLFWLDYNGKIVHKITGGRSVDGLIAEGKKANRPSEREMLAMKSKYDEGNRDVEFLYTYIEALRSTNKGFSDELNTYFQKLTKDQIAEKKNLELIFGTTENISSVSLPFLVAYKANIITNYSQVKYEKKIDGIIKESLEKAAKQKDDALFEKVKDLIRSDRMTAYEEEIQELTLEYYQLSKDWERFANTVELNIKNFKKDPKALDNFAWKGYMNFSNRDLLKMAEDWSSKSLKLEDKYYNNNTFAYLLYKQGALNDALRVAEHAVELAQIEGVRSVAAEGLVVRIKSEINGQGD